MELEERFATVAILAEHYERFVDFARDGMTYLGFNTTWMQADIADFMQDGPRLRMVMAQRGEAKTTLAALYAIWRIIHRPSTRVLIISAGEDNSSDTATLIVRLITTWEILECLRPDKTAGDRTSTQAYDVHWALKGIDRSPSIACAGITSNLPGRRADLLIPDDIESNKNGLTVTQREQLKQLSKEFGSICTHGDILYLGTPQSKDSVYNSLPNRGYTIRIWPGRYPTPEEAEKYGDKLAPSIAERLKADPDLAKGGGIAGDRGKPTDPDRYTDEALIEKEIDKGPEDFALQYMLDTSLADAVRQQLKLSDFVVANFAHDSVPERVSYSSSAQFQYPLPVDFAVQQVKMYTAAPSAAQYVPVPRPKVFCDPAGGGSDELTMFATAAVGPYIHVLSFLSVRGGIEGDNGKNAQAIVDWVREWHPTNIRCESNMGHGTFEANLRSLLYANPDLMDVGVDGEYSTGQKERRIINRLVSSMQRHRIILHPRVFEDDVKCSKGLSIEKRVQYSLFYQIHNITTDRGSLPHDDRVEGLAGAVALHSAAIGVDENKAQEERVKKAAQEYLNNPMGYEHMQKKKTHNSARARATNRWN